MKCKVPKGETQSSGGLFVYAKKNEMGVSRDV